MKKQIAGSLLVAGAMCCVLSIGQAHAASTSSKMSKMGKMGKPMMGNLSAGDKKFLKDAAQGSIAEVQYGKLALQHGSNPSVKSFGQMMVRDHSKALQEAKALASRKGVMTPNQPPAGAKAEMMQASRLHGAAFDAKYKADMIKDHREDIAKAKHEASMGSDPQVRALAKKSAKLFQMHLDHAMQMKTRR